MIRILHNILTSEITVKVFHLTIILGGRGDWSKEGCTVNRRVQDKIFCRCSHLSTFGVLVVSLNLLR